MVSSHPPVSKCPVSGVPSNDLKNKTFGHEFFRTRQLLPGMFATYPYHPIPLYRSVHGYNDGSDRNLATMEDPGSPISQSGVRRPRPRTRTDSPRRSRDGRAGACTSAPLHSLVGRQGCGCQVGHMSRSHVSSFWLIRIRRDPEFTAEFEASKRKQKL